MSTKYIKAYIKICYKAKKENRIKSKENYYENHHIKPRSLGGSDDKSNLVLLTGREHYLAHFLLYKHYKSIKNIRGLSKMGFAFNMMTIGGNGKRYNSYTFEIAHKARFHTDETKGKMSVSATGRKCSQETKDILSEYHKGKQWALGYKHTDEQRTNLSKARTGDKNPQFGKPNTTEQKAKISASKKGKKRSIETMAKISATKKGLEYNEKYLKEYKYLKNQKEK